MKHPESRLERRFNAETWRARQRFVMKSVWRLTPEYITVNRMWWATKQTVGHGNRCACHAEKYAERRKRREALKQSIAENIQSHTE